LNVNGDFNEIGEYLILWRNNSIVKLSKHCILLRKRISWKEWNAIYAR